MLIEIEMPKVIFWNHDINKEVPSDIFIVSTLNRAYNDFIVDKFIEFFGEEMVLSSLEWNKKILSDELIKIVTEYIYTPLASAW